MNKTQEKGKTNFLNLLIVVVFVFVIGFVSGQKSADAGIIYILNDKQPEDVDFSPVWKVWHVIDAKFVPTKTSTSTDEQNVDDLQARVWGMAEGLAASLGDPYTVFLPPADNKIFNEDISGHFEGVGMVIEIKDGILTVVSPLKNTPAYNAGIKAGDKILEIDGVSTEGMSIDEAVKKIRGKKGTKVKLKIYREGEEPFEVEVVRDRIEIPVLETEKLEKDKIFVISLHSFTENSPAKFGQALAEFINSGYDKLILDLRGNPGGYLDAAVDIASWFLPKGAVVVTEDFGDKRPPLVHRSKGYDSVLAGKEVVVLIDKGSASASEILAGALKAYGRATIIGTNSFGKGSVQELIPITNDTSLKVTIARFLLPDGSWIMEKGIKPDIEVEFPEKEELICNPDKRKEFEERDLYIEKAQEFFKNK